MQPNDSADDGSLNAFNQRRFNRAILIVAPVATAFILALLLLLPVQVAEGSSSAPRLGTGDHAIAQAPATNDSKGGGRGRRDEIVGAVVSRPLAGFLGEWQLLITSRGAVAVVVTADTEIDDDFSEPPRLGEWVEVRGVQQPDGTWLADRMRPNEFESGEVVIRLNLARDLAGVLDEYKLTQVDTLLSSANIYLAAMDNEGPEDNLIADLRKDSRVAWAELNYVSVVPSDPEGNPYRTWKWGSSDDSGYINQAALQQVDLFPAQATYTGQGVTVAVLDTGIDGSHPALAGKLLPGRDMVSDDDIPQDGPEMGEAAGVAQGHGTHVSGIIARVAPQSKILPVRVLDVNGRGNTYVLAYAIEWAAQNGANVINLSLGSEFDSHILSDTIAAVQNQGVVVVAAAGNDNASLPQYPANYPGVLGVTAVDSEYHKAGFANYGDSWIDLASPGVGITSTVPVSLPNLYYATWSGTSMAAPFASAAAALVKQQRPDASAQEITQRLIDSGRKIDAANPDYTGKLGRMLDIGAALGVAPKAMLYLPAVQREN